jgi:hypothetical protein
MAYESMTTTETTTSACPAAIEDYVRGRAFFPIPYPIHRSAWKANSANFALKLSDKYKQARI